MTRLRIRTASRLHFGLLGWGPHVRRQFGGVGLMVEEPGLELAAEPAERFHAAGPLAPRVAALLDRIPDRWTGPTPVRPVRIEVVRAPEEHAGLGVGTQLSLAVARLVLAASGVEEPTLDQLARLSERGRRSGVGLHGFLHGGLIVDGGHATPGDVPPMVSRLDFPEDWSILIVRPPAPSGRHGGDEAAAFAGLPPVPERTSERLCRLVLLDLLSAAAGRDLDAFGAALGEIQREVGAAFAPAQGGVYAGPESESLVAELGRLGLVGAGQSSWGPSLYAFGTPSDDQKRALTARLRDRHDLGPRDVFWTRARNRGAGLATAATPGPA
ncbi:beta-ribofuranosylaminobenzene 5'-phosphate synthase family protein [Paludisphaera mucosa]|uniref:Beta-RFAP synthase n=1 Tax=Paludisphaera mucosa TaxID=3030827 RepID=A0ABT6FB59_9BACT|nr:beta-ribofuranosylaminobenzene 5'-phosphate synthase family protein [Paludisphaera mucosa]MDG3004824.1 beta-RFAP synthase [Paludisphaera mucosa]